MWVRIFEARARPRTETTQSLISQVSRSRSKRADEGARVKARMYARVETCVLASL